MRRIDQMASSLHKYTRVESSEMAVEEDGRRKMGGDFVVEAGGVEWKRVTKRLAQKNGRCSKRNFTRNTSDCPLVGIRDKTDEGERGCC